MLLFTLLLKFFAHQYYHQPTLYTREALRLFTEKTPSATLLAVRLNFVGCRCPFFNFVLIKGNVVSVCLPGCFYVGGFVTNNSQTKAMFWSTARCLGRLVFLMGGRLMGRFEVFCSHKVLSGGGKAGACPCRYL